MFPGKTVDLSEWPGRSVQRNADDRVIGGAVLLPLPPGNDDLEIGRQLHPVARGDGYATETTRVPADHLVPAAIDLPVAPPSRSAAAPTRVP